jgi:hypothetical protein
VNNLFDVLLNSVCHYFVEDYKKIIKHANKGA